MPHKRNPITGERLSGLARVLRGNAVAALENVALWHERDISHSASSASSFRIPARCSITCSSRCGSSSSGCSFIPRTWSAILAADEGPLLQPVDSARAHRAGAERKTAYEAVQRAAMRTWKGEKSFAENAKEEPEITARITPAEIDSLCSLEVHFRHVDETFRALGLN